MHGLRVVPAVLERLLEGEGDAAKAVSDLVAADRQAGFAWFVLGVALLRLEVWAAAEHGRLELCVEVKVALCDARDSLDSCPEVCRELLVAVDVEKEVAAEGVEGREDVVDLGGALESRGLVDGAVC